MGLRTELFHRVCLGNADAVAFLNDIVDVLHVWDDLIDKDTFVGDATICDAFWRALIALPRNPFYAAHFDKLSPVLALAITNWQAANAIERAEEPTEGDLMIAFVIRSTYVDLVTMCALICGGQEHADELAADIRRFAHSEGFEAYKANLANEKRLRESRNVL